jgi:hypothetical protein
MYREGYSRMKSQSQITVKNRSNWRLYIINTFNVLTKSVPELNKALCIVYSQINHEQNQKSIEIGLQLLEFNSPIGRTRHLYGT